jgi:hypothetical protein
MTSQEARADIISSLQQQSINVLVNTLAEMRVENEMLKARVAELELAAKPKAKAA